MSIGFIAPGGHFALYISFVWLLTFSENMEFPDVEEKQPSKRADFLIFVAKIPTSSDHHIHIMRQKAVGQLLVDFACAEPGCDYREKRVIGVPG